MLSGYGPQGCIVIIMLSVKKQMRLDAALEGALRKLGTVTWSNRYAVIVYFLVKINPGAVHWANCHWACAESCAFPGHQSALLVPTFSDLMWTGTEEEGSQKRCS